MNDTFQSTEALNLGDGASEAGRGQAQSKLRIDQSTKSPAHGSSHPMKGQMSLKMTILPTMKSSVHTSMQSHL
jgi:hypothetical protein